MPGEWPFTGLGRTFFDGTLPQLVKNIGLVALELKRYNDNVEKQIESEKQSVRAGDSICLNCSGRVFYEGKWGWIHYDEQPTDCEDPLGTEVTA